ncbi:MAG TPA: agmatine deiminase [Deltaproteobacteria bacterium]|nr:MAG: agmatine deiminase [Deltaproteobacteria bacterium GWA2_45_12]HBF12003.1 agmatine deiminase [Deltaproteobacteria bacterium]
MPPTPSQLEYRMPAEWELHSATWLAWPHNKSSWPGKIELIPDVYVQMVKALHEGEDVHINVNDQAMENKVHEKLFRSGCNMKHVFLHQFPNNDAWIRDHGPIFVTRSLQNKKELAVTDWDFNKWGGKYPPWDLDNIVPEKIAKYLGVPAFRSRMILEGGSIDVNGNGYLLTTESCLLNKNRNPGMTKPEIEEQLKQYLGVSHILWLGDGIIGDDTDGHVDDLSRFVNTNTILTVVEEDPRDENYKVLQDNLKRLSSMKDQDGKAFNIIPLPMPGPVVYQGERLPASYANFYIANKVVLVPTFKNLNDKKALETLQNLFSTRKVVGINATDLIWGLGAFHCLTQQQPAV